MFRNRMLVCLGVALGIGYFVAIRTISENAVAAETSLQDGQFEGEADSNPGSSKLYVKPADAELKKKLTSLQYNVTQREGTEPPFRNEHAARVDRPHLRRGHAIGQPVLDRELGRGTRRRVLADSGAATEDGRERPRRPV